MYGKYLVQKQIVSTLSTNLLKCLSMVYNIHFRFSHKAIYRVHNREYNLYIVSPPPPATSNR